MRQPTPIWAGYYAMPGDDGMSGLLGALGDCPAGLFPNINSPGFCTNIPTDQQRSGGNYSAPPAPVGPAVIAPPVDTAIVQANQDTRFGLQLTPDRGTQERLVAEVTAQAARRGCTASCHIATNTAPAMLGIPGYLGYAAYCSVCGGSEDSAAQLLLPGHLDVYEINNPGAVIPGLTSPASSAPSNSPGAPPAVQSPVAPIATPPTSTTTGAPVPVSAGSGFDPTAIWSDVNSTVAPFADKLGVPSWALLAAAGVAAFMVFGGKR